MPTFTQLQPQNKQSSGDTAMMIELLKSKLGQSSGGEAGGLNDLLGNINPQTIGAFGDIVGGLSGGGTVSDDDITAAVGVLGEEEDDEKSTGQKIGGAAGGALSGAQVGSMAGPVGMGVGALLGGLSGYFM